MNHPQPRNEPQLLQFGLRQLMAFVAVVTGLCALMTAGGAGWRLVVGSLAALIAAHVFGTIVGTRLRDSSSELQHWKAQGPPANRDDPVATPQPVRFSELTLPAGTPLALCELAPRRSLGSLAAGMAVGGSLGAAAILLIGGERVSWAGAAIGGLSCGVIGAWAALLGTSFVAIARRTWRQASSESRGQ